MNASTLTRPLVTTAAGHLDNDTTVWVESGVDGKLRIHTTHATADCSGIHASSTIAATTWGEASGDLFCPASCIDIARRTDWQQLIGTGSGKRLDDRVERTIERNAKALQARPANLASDKQMDFIGKLMIEKGHGDTDPVALLYTSDNNAARKDGRLTKKEASQLIELLLALPTAADPVPVDAAAKPAAEVEAWLAGLTAKVEASWLDDLADDNEAEFVALEAAAVEWVLTQQGVDFEWLADVAAKAAAGQWAPRYLKGTLNCWRAAVRRGETTANVPASTASPSPAAPAEAPARVASLDLTNVPAGRYAVPGGDTRLKVRIDAPDKGKWAGWVFVKDAAEYGSGQRYGSQKPGGTYRGAIEDQLRIIAADPAAAMAAYGHLTDTCGACGRGLEDEASVARGIGPVCAAKYGWA